MLREERVKRVIQLATGAHFLIHPRTEQAVNAMYFSSSHSIVVLQSRRTLCTAEPRPFFLVFFATCSSPFARVMATAHATKQRDELRNRNFVNMSRLIEIRPRLFDQGHQSLLSML